MKLQKVDRVEAKFLADLIRIFDDVIGGKYVVIVVSGERGPFAVGRRNFRGGIEAFFITCHGFAEQAVALTFAVGPCGVEEIAARVDGELQGIKRLLVIGAAPAAHAPQPVSDVADGKTGAPQLAIFHVSSLMMGFDYPDMVAVSARGFEIGGRNLGSKSWSAKSFNTGAEGLAE